MNSRMKDEALKLSVEEMIEGIQIVDASWRYLYVNHAAADHGRKFREDLLGRTMLEVYPGIEESPFFKDLQRVMEDRVPRRMENQFFFEDKSFCWFELFMEPDVHGVLIRSIDITERKALEEQLRHSQRMEAIGRLAGGIAHDFNNKLAVMMVYGEMAADKVKNALHPDPQLADFISKILDAVKHSTALTRQLLAFSRKQVLDLKVVNLNALLEKTKPSLVQLLGEKILVELHLASQLKSARLDASQMDQVILNLCVNARDAMPDGGKLVLETANIELDQSYADTHPEVEPGLYVMLSVSDTGSGMSKEVQSRIFEPFYTTKPKDVGTGLGLATTHGIIRQSHGHIWVYSEPGMGSVFKIYFPVAAGEEAAEDPVERQPARYHGDETLLLVEDEPVLRKAYASALGGAGYRVLIAKDGVEGEKIFNDSSFPVQLLLTDVVLPKRNGKQLADVLIAKNPQLKVIFMSGYTENSIVHQGILDTESVLLQKPISIRGLLETLRKVLDGHVKKGVF